MTNQKIKDMEEDLEFAARAILGLVRSPKRTHFVHFNTDYAEEAVVYISLSEYELDKFGLFSGKTEQILDNVKIPVNVWADIIKRQL